MDIWSALDAVKAQFTPLLLDKAENWLAYASNSAWFWFLLAMLAAVWISKRFVVDPLARLIEFRTQVTQMDNRFHTLANELKYMRITIDDLHGLMSNLKEEREAVEDMRLLADELRTIVGSLRNERDDVQELRSAMQEIRSALKSLKSEHDGKTDELRSGLNSLIDDYEQARVN